MCAPSSLLSFMKILKVVKQILTNKLVGYINSAKIIII
jgi:hypothetical protein